MNDKLGAFPEWNASSIDQRHDLLIVWKTTPLET
jgi:hypothetical protein